MAFLNASIGRNPHSLSTARQRCSHFQTPKCVVILGGTSGVGLEAATYLRQSKGVAATSFSRRTGHDLNDPQVSKSILPLAENGLAICVGGGRRPTSREEELLLYRTIISGLLQAPTVSLVVAVARALVLSDVRTMMDELNSPWVILRPGPLVNVDYSNPNERDGENLLVTPDPRCNGLVSRRGVGVVVGDLLHSNSPISDVSGQVLGVYDENRMISFPRGVKQVRAGKWGEDAL